MAYQGPDGQWYDDNGEPIVNSAPPPTGEIAPPQFSYPSGGTAYAAGPRPGGSVVSGVTGPNGEPIYTNPPPISSPAPTGGGGGSPSPTDWAGLSQSMFGSMPSVGQYTPPPFSYDPFTAPDPFSAPNGQDVLNADPGYQFRLNQGLGAMQNSAAARGVLNTGGTLQDLVNYGQNAASQEYGNAYNRALGTYQTNFNDKLQGYLTNFGNALTKYNTNYNTNFLTPYNQLMGQYGQGVANQAQIFGQRFNTATA